MSLQPNVSDLLSDRALGAVSFPVSRYENQWVKGEQVEVCAKRIRAVGVIQPAKAETLQHLPEGARRQGAISIHTAVLLQEKDELQWRGERYIIAAVNRWDEYGWCQAVATFAPARKGA